MLMNRIGDAIARSCAGAFAVSSDLMVWLMQVNGAVGCLARIPLPSRAFRAPHIPLPWLSHKQADAEQGASDADPAATADSSSAHGRFARELWEPYLQDTSLRVFASCGLSGQVRFWFFFDSRRACSFKADLVLLVLCWSDDALSSAQALRCDCGEQVLASCSKGHDSWALAGIAQLHMDFL